MITNSSAANTAHSGQIAHSDDAANEVFGFWLYLMSDLILFSILFATYAVLGRNYADGPTGKILFDLPYVFIETMVLLLSSVTYGFVVLAMQKDNVRLVLIWLGVTFLLGAGFVSMELDEFHNMIVAGNGPDRSGFLSAFFTLVGTHGIHVTFGLVWLSVMMGQVLTKTLSAPVRSRLLRLSMFWHFLDIVWICIFTVVYLIGVI